MKVAVKFLKPWRSYVRGETAGFAPDIAAKLISGGVAFDTAGPRPGAALSQADRDLLRAIKAAGFRVREGIDAPGSDAADAPRPEAAGIVVQGVHVETAETGAPVITGNAVEHPGGVITGQIRSAPEGDDTGAAGGGADTVEASGGDDTGAAGDGADTVEAAEGDDTAKGKPKEAGAPPRQGRKRT